MSLARSSGCSPPFDFSIITNHCTFAAGFGPRQGFSGIPAEREEEKQKENIPTLHPVPDPLGKQRQGKRCLFPFGVTFHGVTAALQTSLSTVALTNRLEKNPTRRSVGLTSSRKTRYILRERARESGREREREGRDCHHPRSDVSF